MIPLLIAVGLAGLVYSCYRIVLHHETVKAERAKFQRIVSANRESRGWPPPSGPKGFNRNRRKAA